jgi:hypothetical protein
MATQISWVEVTCDISEDSDGYINEGSFGTVFKGVLRGEPVAVCVFK